MESPSQIIHRIKGSPEVPGCAAAAIPACWVCGRASARGILRHRWMGSNFTGQNKVRCASATHVCEACVLVMSGKPPDTERMYSHFVEGDSWLRVNKGQKPAMREFLRRTKAAPWFAAIADSGQKHVIPWTPVNAAGQAGGRVLFEEALVELPRDDAGWSMLDDIALMLTDGATKDEILPGHWGPRAYSLIGPERIEAFESAWGGMRGGAWFELAVWLAQRDEAKVAVRMEAEKAERAAKKAKAKEAERGDRKGPKGKTSDAHRGGDPRPAKRVPRNGGVQPAQSLAGPHRQDPGRGEVVSISGGVVHDNATVPTTLSARQEQFSFVF